VEVAWNPVEAYKKEKRIEVLLPLEDYRYRRSGFGGPLQKLKRKDSMGAAQQARQVLGAVEPLKDILLKKKGGE